MHEDLLHHPVEEVLPLGVRASRHHLLELAEETSQHVAVDRGKLQLLAPRLEVCCSSTTTARLRSPIEFSDSTGASVQRELKRHEESRREESADRRILVSSMRYGHHPNPRG